MAEVIRSVPGGLLKLRECVFPRKEILQTFSTRHRGAIGQAPAGSPALLPRQTIVTRERTVYGKPIASNAGMSAG